MEGLKLDMSKLDQFAEDLSKLEPPKVVKGEGSEGGAVPVFQSKGYLEKLGTKNTKWYKRFFVLRDSFLLSYNLQKSDFTVEPNKCIHLVKCKFEVFEMGDKKFCFAITTQDKDRFVFSCASEKERNAWRKDIEIARIISHKNMVKLAVENQTLAEAKGLSDAIKNFSTSALSLFSNADYIRRTPVTGGAEGWLRTPGFCVSKKGNKALKKGYFMLVDSHLLMFHGGDALKKPRGAMYLVGTRTVEMEDENEGNFRFVTSSAHCADFVELVASSEAQRQRWINALKIGSRVTYGDFKLLLKEHELLTNFKPGESSPEMEAPKADEQPLDQVQFEDTGLQGEELEPGTQQPYDAEGNPIIRNPEGRLVDAKGEEIGAKTHRFNKDGKRLDAFNRLLPDGAVPMFTKEGQAIGVGPDGKHYLPDGTEIGLDDPHYDESGNELAKDVVVKADAVAAQVDVAIKVRQKMKGEGAGVEEVDVLGRTFRPGKDKKSDMVTNADGVQVPVQTARRVVKADGSLAQEEVKKEKQFGKLVIKVDNEGEQTELGAVEVDEETTMTEVRGMILDDVKQHFSDFRFLVNLVPITKAEEEVHLAVACLPEVVIRGIELKTVKPSSKFTKKVDSMLAYEQQKDKEKEEFTDIMAKVRAGNFLRKTKE